MEGERDRPGERKDYLSKREVILMDSVSIKGWQFGYVFGCTVGGLNMLWGPFWVRMGSVWGIISQCICSCWCFWAKSEFLHFFNYPKGKK